MECLKPIFRMTGIIVVIIFTLAVQEAKAAENMKITVIFHEEVTWNEIYNYVAMWQKDGGILIRYFPFMNGVVLSIPPEFSSGDLVSDQRIAGIQCLRPQPEHQLSDFSEGRGGLQTGLN